MSDFASRVELELIRARRAFQTLHSHHEAYGVLAEELAEYFDEVRKKDGDREPSRLLKELVQIAAMSQRTAEDLGLI